MGPDSPAVPPHPRSITPSPPTWHLSLHPSDPVQSRPGNQALSYLSQLHPKIQPVTPSILLPLGPSSLLGNKQGFLLFPTQIPAPVHFRGQTPIHVCLSLPRSTPNPIRHWDPKPPLLSLVLYGQMVWLLNPQVLPHPGDSPHPALNWLLQSCHLMPPNPLKIPEFQLDTDASSKTDCLVCDQVGLPSCVGGFGSVSSSPVCSRTSILHPQPSPHEEKYPEPTTTCRFPCGIPILPHMPALLQLNSSQPALVFWDPLPPLQDPNTQLPSPAVLS